MYMQLRKRSIEYGLYLCFLGAVENPQDIILIYQ